MEKQLAEAQLALRALGVHHRSSMPPAATPSSAEETASSVTDPDAKALARPRSAQPAYHHMREPVFEPSWKAEGASLYDQYEAADGIDGEQYDPERYIFCSRAYMFDAIRSPVARRTTGPRKADLELPSAMPARFRYAAQLQQQQQVPQLTDGDNASSSARPTDSALAHHPVVNLLLPSAALQGVRGVGGFDADAADAHGRASSSHTANDRNSLIQVQCAVLNASRFS